MTISSTIKYHLTAQKVDRVPSYASSAGWHFAISTHFWHSNKFVCLTRLLCRCRRETLFASLNILLCYAIKKIIVHNECLWWFSSQEKRERRARIKCCKCWVHKMTQVPHTTDLRSAFRSKTFFFSFQLTFLCDFNVYKKSLILTFYFFFSPFASQMMPQRWKVLPNVAEQLIN